MKVLFVSNNYIPYQSGVTRSIQATVHGLLQHEVEIKLLAPDYKWAVSDPYYVTRVPALFAFSYKGNRIPFMYCRTQFVRKVIEEFKPDVIHVHHPFILGMDALKSAQKYSIPLIFTFHTQYDQYVHYMPGVNYVCHWLLWRHISWFCRHVDMLIFPSQSLKRIVETRMMVKNAIILPSPIAPEFFSIKKHARTTAKPYHLLYVGRFVPEKNIPFLLNVVKKLGHDYRLTLAGYGYGLQSLKRYAYETLYLTRDQIQFIEKPTRQQILDQYYAAELFVFASQTETQGLVLAEAMACGVPVIALYGCGVIDIVNPGINGYIVHTQDEMVKRIKEIMENQVLKECMRKNAQETSLQYEPSIIVRKLLNCYNDSHFYSKIGDSI